MQHGLGSGFNTSVLAPEASSIKLGGRCRGGAVRMRTTSIHESARYSHGWRCPAYSTVCAKLVLWYIVSEDEGCNEDDVVIGSIGFDVFVLHFSILCATTLRLGAMRIQCLSRVEKLLGRVISVPKYSYAVPYYAAATRWASWAMLGWCHG
ncbi:hypothetical protein P154DRAFT_582161 [Amniculicola lignicola CBS 123094]|uniref:Uncharacterized protein n=1 Tax=Amniculicola lignicola CBS 123094 TaxID=1392246 RepID=A0A6A5VWZ4_9PLEO|nr:hypothetical protein P154DRAFT_582161 [Amniculicola lignicola CBS 123094]